MTVSAVASAIMLSAVATAISPVVTTEKVVVMAESAFPFSTAYGDMEADPRVLMRRCASNVLAKSYHLGFLLSNEQVSYLREVTCKKNLFLFLTAAAAPLQR